MTEPKKKTPQELLEEAKKMIGTTGKPIVAKYPVEYEPISRYCKMVEDTNPLFLDREYAKNTKWGSVIMPPLAATLFIQSMWPPLPPEELVVLPPTPGKMIMNMATEVESFRPARIGDMLTATPRLADVFMKEMAIDPNAFWITSEINITNQKGELIASVKNILVSHRTPQELEEAGK